MKKLSLIVIAFLAPVVALAQASYLINVDFKTGNAVQAAAVKVGSLEDVALLGDVDVSGLFALQSNTSLGLAFTKSRAVARNAELVGGLSVRSLQEVGSDRVGFRFGAVLGVSWRF